MEGKAPPNMINQLERYYCLALNFNYSEHRQNLVFFLSVFEGSNFDFITRGFLLSNLRDITSISFRLGRSTRNITETSDIDAKIQSVIGARTARRGRQPGVVPHHVGI